MMRYFEDRIEKMSCSDGIARAIHIWEPEKPRAVFLMVHGGMDHGGNYYTPGLYFKKYGIATAAPELHGHDMKRKVKIPGFYVFLDDLALMIQWVKGEYKDLPIMILSHSMGGLVTTLYGLNRFEGDPLIRGFISSSPYYVNAIRAPWIVKKLAGMLSALTPNMAVPIESLIHVASHDEEVYKRYQQEEKEEIMASRVSARFANEILKAQRIIANNGLSGWKYPMLVILAGEDRYVDVDAARSLLDEIDQALLTVLFYPENYHENFKELNREEVFQKMMEWTEPRIT